MQALSYLQVDVFSAAPFGGNGLPVFYDAPSLGADALQRITCELRQFEAVFLQPDADHRCARTRVFDLLEELPFAGHPLIGAAAALQHRYASGGDGSWTLELPSRSARVDVRFRGDHYFGTLDQGAPRFLGVVDDREAIARAFALAGSSLVPGLPLEVASTGLVYLVVPTEPGAIGSARIGSDITELLKANGAQFAVLFDPSTFEIRHWNNDGIVEDIATGSAAGVVAAYAVKHGLARAGEDFSFSQGRFQRRPSVLEVRVDQVGDALGSVKVGGAVAIVGEGRLFQAPRP